MSSKRLSNLTISRLFSKGKREVIYDLHLFAGDVVYHQAILAEGDADHAVFATKDALLQGVEFAIEGVVLVPHDVGI